MVLAHLQKRIVTKNKSISPLLLLAQASRLRLLVFSLSIQLGVALCTVALFTVLFSVAGMLSAVLGAVIAILANMVFLFAALRYFGCRFSKTIMHHVIWGEVAKVTLIITGFTLCFVFLGSWLSALAVLVSFALVYASQSILLLYGRCHAMF